MTGERGVTAVVDGGNPFTPIAKSIASDGTVSDGPVGVMATGYTIVKADSLDEAAGMAKNCTSMQHRCQTREILSGRCVSAVSMGCMLRGPV